MEEGVGVCGLGELVVDGLCALSGESLLFCALLGLLGLSGAEEGLEVGEGGGEGGGESGVGGLKGGMGLSGLLGRGRLSGGET